MQKRGRKSAAELQIVSPETLESIKRPAPPDDVTDEQADEWWSIVNRMPADWFPRETHGLLVQYCRHIVTARRVAQLICDAEGADNLSIDDLDKLYKMQEREGRAMSSLATRMRISQQATFDKERKKGSRGVRKPWEG